MHPAPLAWCFCGLHAMKSLSYLCSRSGVAFDLIVTSRFGILMGTVELAGKVIEYGYGYRAQFARLVEIAPAPGQEELAQLAASIYGVPVSTVLVAAGTLQDIL
jgi:hypothetical protein